MTDAPPGSSRELSYFFTVPLRRWPTVLLTMLVFGVGALALLQVLATTASASATVNLNAFSADPFQDTRPVEQLIDMPAEVQVAESPAVISTAAQSLDREDDAADIGGGVEATGAVGGTTMTITYVGSSPAQAATVANAVARAYLEYRASEARERQGSVLRLINARLARAQSSLRAADERVSDARPGSVRAARAQSARTVYIARIADLTARKNSAATTVLLSGSLVDPATADEAVVSPRPGVVLPTALLLGLGLGLLLTFLEERLDKRLRRPSQLVDVARAPVLAMVSPHVYDERPSPTDVAALRLLRARMLAAVPGSAFSLLVVDLDGRSSLSRLGRHLAALVATSGLPVTMLRVGRVSDQLRREEVELENTAPAGGGGADRTLELAGSRRDPGHAANGAARHETELADSGHEPGRTDDGAAGRDVELADLMGADPGQPDGAAGREVELADPSHVDVRAGLTIEEVVDGEVALADTLEGPRVAQRVRELQRQGRAVIVAPAVSLERSEVIALARSVEAVVVVAHGSSSDHRDIAAMCEDARRSGAEVLGTIWCTKQRWWNRQRGYATSLDAVEHPRAVPAWQ